jgi:S1-C subfamily serine protease
VHPKPQHYAYDLDAALSSVVGIRSIVPNDASSAETLGTEREGNGVLIRSDGLVLTIGYLVTEAETLWITLSDGRVFPGHVLGQDHQTGFAVVQALARLDLSYLQLGDSSRTEIGERVVVGGAGGRKNAVAARIIAKQEFAGAWEYLLDEALFTAPAHPLWGGTAVIGAAGELIGIGSLQLQHELRSGESIDLNMVVPIDLLKPILDDLVTLGRRSGPARPWLGIYAAKIGNEIVITGVARRGPARKANLRAGDVVVGVGSDEVSELAGLFRHIWALGEAGVEVPLSVRRNGQSLDIRVRSADRRRVLKRPILH